MLFLISPPIFGPAGERLGPAFLSTNIGEREAWHPVCLIQPVADIETGDVLDAGWKVWRGPYDDFISDATLLAIAAPGYGSSHTGSTVAGPVTLSL